MWSTSTYLIDHNQFIIFTMFLSSCATLTPPPTCKKNTKQSLSNEKGCLCLNFPFFLSENPMDFFSQPKDLGGFAQAFRCKRKQNLHSNLLPNCWVNDGEKATLGSNPWTKNPSTQQIQAMDQKNTHLPNDQPGSPRRLMRPFNSWLVGSKKSLEMMEIPKNRQPKDGDFPKIYK